jgi:hypothetical protein
LKPIGTFTTNSIPPNAVTNKSLQAMVVSHSIEL